MGRPVAHYKIPRHAENAPMDIPLSRYCITCRYYAYRPCYVAGEYDVGAHCARRIHCFPDASRCRDYEREPGSDDEDPTFEVSPEQRMP